MKDNERKLYKLSTSQKELSLSVFPRNRCDILNMVGFHSYMEKDFRPDLLEKCWNRVLEMYDSLRLRMVGLVRVRQYVEPYKYEALQTVKVNGIEGFKEFEAEQREIKVHMYGGALYRVFLVDCGNGAGGMVACLHNLCCDGYTLEMIFGQMESLYALALEGKEFPPYKERSYLEYLKVDKKYMRFNSKEKREDFKWWLNKYFHLRNYTIPVGRTTRKYATGDIISDIPVETYEKLVAISEKCRCPVTSAVMTVMALTTYAMTKKKSFCFFNLSHGRRTYVMKQTPGCMFMVNLMFFHIDTKKSFSELASLDYINYLEALQHGRYPWANHLELGYFQSLKLGLNFHHHWIYFSSMGLGRLSANSKLGMEAFNEGHMENPMYCAVYDIAQENRMRLDLNYQSKKFTAQQAQRMKESFEAVLKQCVEHPETAIEELRF